MQLLVDTTQETPTTLMFIANTLVNLVNMALDDGQPPYHITTVKILADKPATQTPSINGPSLPIVLHAHGPAAPIDPAPVANSDPGQMNPAEVFGRGVPVGTITQDPTLPAAMSTPIAPPVPAVLLGSAPPVPLTTLATALPATIAPVAPSAGAPVVANAPAQDTAAVVTASDRDAEGLPWDARVHSETKKQNADGTWRYRRNLDPNVKATVVAELKAAYGNQQIAPLAPVAPPAPAPEAPPAPTVPVAPQPPAAPMPVSDGVSLGVPDAPQPPVVQALGFRDFMSAVNKALAAGRMTQDQLTTACKAVNLDGITALAGEPMKIALVHSQIAHLLGAATA